MVTLLGAGWEGEVYLVRERGTGIERTVKIFFPRRNPRDRTLRFYARKLHKLRHCPVVIQYHTRDTFIYNDTKVSFLLSEFVEGELLSDFLKRQRGCRLSPFQGVHLLHALAIGIESIHKLGDYHGDLHTDNIIVLRYGLGFELKLLDMFHWGAPMQRIFNMTCTISFASSTMLSVGSATMRGNRRRLKTSVKGLSGH